LSHARLEVSLSSIDEDVLQCSRIEKRIGRNRELPPKRYAQFEVHKHVRLECQIGLGKLHAHFYSSRLGVERRRNENDAALPPIQIGTVGQLNLYRLTELQKRQVGFVHLTQHPNSGQIHDRIEVHLWSDIPAVVVRLPLHHHARDRRINRQSALHLTSLFKRFDFGGTDIPKQ